MLNGLVKIIKSIADGLSAICSFLLIRLWLWIPALYSILYIIICAATGIKFTGDVMLIFFAGLILAFSASLGILIYRGSQKGVKTHTKPIAERPRSNMAGTKLKTESSTNEMIPKPTRRREPPQNYNDFSDLERKYFEARSAKEEEDDGKEDYYGSYPAREEHAEQRTYRQENRESVRQAPAESSQSYPQYHRQAYPPQHRSAHPSHEAAVTLREEPDAVLRANLQQRQADDTPEETPMIFATRKDPDILIYEYSDKLQYYRKRKNRLELIRTEYKD